MTHLPALSSALLVLRDADLPAEARLAAAAALGRIGSSRAVDALAGLLCRPEPPAVQAAAAVALGRIGDRSALTALTAGLASPEPAVRSASAGALARLGDEGPVWLAEIAVGRGPGADAARLALAGHEVPGRLDALDAFLSLAGEPLRS